MKFSGQLHFFLSFFVFLLNAFDHHPFLFGSFFLSPLQFGFMRKGLLVRFFFFQRDDGRKNRGEASIDLLLYRPDKMPSVIYLQNTLRSVLNPFPKSLIAITTDNLDVLMIF